MLAVFLSHSYKSLNLHGGANAGVAKISSAAVVSRNICIPFVQTFPLWGFQLRAGLEDDFKCRHLLFSFAAAKVKACEEEVTCSGFSVVHVSSLASNVLSLL